MTIRETSFGDLFKIGFWVNLGPSLFAIVLAGVFVSGVFLFTPELPAAMAELGLLGVPESFADVGAGTAIAFVWGIVLAYGLAVTLFAALRTLSGALLLMAWRAMFMKEGASVRPARAKTPDVHQRLAPT